MTEKKRALDADRLEAAGINKDAIAKLVHLPHYRNAAAASSFGSATIGMSPDPVAGLQLVSEQCARVQRNELSLITDILTTQAMTLDAVFTDLLKRAGSNLGQYPDAAERFMRMSMKAQSQCRTTLEALAKVARGGEQVVRHIHVNNGGQAVIAENVHTGGQNANGTGQPYEPSAALLGEDTGGNGVPLACGARPEAVPSPWRGEGEWGTDGE